MANTHLIAPPYGSGAGGNEMGGSGVSVQNVLMIEMTGVGQSPCLHLVWCRLSVFLVYVREKMKFIHLNPCSLMNCANKK